MTKLSLNEQNSKTRILQIHECTYVTLEQSNLCESKIQETDLFGSMKIMKNISDLNNDGLTEEFYKCF